LECVSKPRTVSYNFDAFFAMQVCDNVAQLQTKTARDLKSKYVI
jgi:hypothetical protein